MKFHILPVVCEVRVASGEGEFVFGEPYDSSFNLHIAGHTAYLSGVDQAVPGSVLRGVTRYARAHGATSIKYNRKGIDKMKRLLTR
jgi:hypothetical protein